MVEEFRIMNEDYIPLTALFKEKKANSLKRTPSFKTSPIYTTLVLYIPLEEQVHANEGDNSKALLPLLT
jgi:hypothetical protein